MESKSYFASGLFATLFKKIAIHHADFFSTEEDPAAIAKFLIRTFFAEFKSAVSYLELNIAETLSTIVYSVVNIETKEACSVMIGDGTVYVDGKIETEKPENNAPQYISLFFHKSFEELWEEDVFCYNHTVEKTISVMSDGIDSFRNMKENRFVTDEEKEYIVEILLKNEKFFKNAIGMARKCNILENEKLVPSDDLSIARLVFFENEE